MFNTKRYVTTTRVVRLLCFCPRDQFVKQSVAHGTTRTFILDICDNAINLGVIDKNNTLLTSSLFLGIILCTHYAVYSLLLRSLSLQGLADVVILDDFHRHPSFIPTRLITDKFLHAVCEVPTHSTGFPFCERDIYVGGLST